MRQGKLEAELERLHGQLDKKEITRGLAQHETPNVIKKEKQIARLTSQVKELESESQKLLTARNLRTVEARSQKSTKFRSQKLYCVLQLTVCTDPVVGPFPGDIFNLLYFPAIFLSCVLP